MTTAMHRAATPPQHRVSDLLSTLRAWALSWWKESGVLFAYDTADVVSDVNGALDALSGRWRARRDAAIQAEADAKRDRLLAWGQDAQWGQAIKSMAARRHYNGRHFG